MTESDLRNILNDQSTPRNYRPIFARLLHEDHQLATVFLEGILLNEAPFSSKLALSLEFACRDDLKIIHAVYDKFFTVLEVPDLEGSIRSFSKILEMVVRAAYSKNEALVKLYPLSSKQKEVITQACFQWLIGPYKVATQAQAMDCLFWLGHDIEWVHPELREVLLQGYPNGSAGYQSRARKILDKIGN
ncbi:adenylosuccinate lyase [Sediminicola luteus]|uniref:adenylosuccinate lyase n=1 Tax=Sediminicola luteus TaxID=319238 RepID=UPI0011412C89|nr:adenylosuccinate lyase [Sediminicola luteus]